MSTQQSESTHRPSVPFSSPILRGQPFQDLAAKPPVESPEAMLDGWGAVREAGVVFEKAIGRYITISAALLQILANPFAQALSFCCWPSGVTIASSQSRSGKFLSPMNRM